jgi:hypothetical protein
MADVLSNWPFNSIVPDDDEPLYDILVAMEEELDRIDVQADELMEQRFLDTATTKELDKLSREVGVTRRTGENDTSLQYRAQLAKSISSSKGTTPQFAQTLELAFGDDVDNVNITTPTAAPQITLEIPEVLINDIPLTRAELEDELNDAVPAGDSVSIVSSDTFILGESGSQGIGEGELI